MRGLAGGQSAGPDLYGFDPARLGEADIGERPPPDILVMRGHSVRFGLDDEIGLSEFLGRFPLIGGRPHFRSRHIFGVAERRACVDPTGDRVDLVLRERHVILKLLDADGRVDVPRRHLAGDHALADRLSPGAGLFIGDQGHGRHGTFVMALLALFLKNGSDVFGESGLSRAGGERRSGDESAAQQCRGSEISAQVQHGMDHTSLLFTVCRGETDRLTV